jgi:uncharacterized membrane protein
VEVALVWIVGMVSAAAVLWRVFSPNLVHGSPPDPKAVLAQRYAAGEIDEAEYLTRLAILKDANELTP